MNLKWKTLKNISMRAFFDLLSGTRICNYKLNTTTNRPLAGLINQITTLESLWLEICSQDHSRVNKLHLQYWALSNFSDFYLAVLFASRMESSQKVESIIYNKLPQYILSFWADIEIQNMKYCPSKKIRIFWKNVYVRGLAFHSLR